jgi:hypothetical protein
MTETETLLHKAQDIALRAFEEPTEGAVMDIFRRLCSENDDAKMERDVTAFSGTVH